MTWLFANLIPAVVIWGGISGFPLWLVLKREYAADVEARPAVAKSTVTWPADRPVPIEAELARAHRDRIRRQRTPVPAQVPVTAAR